MNEHIVIDKDIRHGKPLIKGTRITVEEVLGALAGGMAYDEIEEEYGIGRDGIQAAVSYAAGWMQGEEVTPVETYRARK